MPEWENYGYFIVSMWIQKRGLNDSEKNKTLKRESVKKINKDLSFKLQWPLCFEVSPDTRK